MKLYKVVMDGVVTHTWATNKIETYNNGLGHFQSKKGHRDVKKHKITERTMMMH